MSLTIHPVSPEATANHRDLSSDAIIVPVYEGGAIPEWLAPKTLHKSGFTGAKGDLLTEWSDDGDRRYIFVGLGKPVDPASPFTVESTQSAAALVAKTAKKLKIVDAAMLVIEGKISSLYDVYMGFLLGDYEFTCKSKQPSSHKYSLTVAIPESYVGYDEAAQQRLIDKATKVVYSIATVRNLVSNGANIVTPRFMCVMANCVHSSTGRVTCTIHGRSELEEMSANLILAVNKGSGDHPEHQAALIHLTYRPESSPDKMLPEVWLLGKGVTFDSGGLDLKLAGNMRHMRIDMAGAAACLGIMEALVALNPDGIVVHCVMPVTDNMTGPNAYKCGDIYTSMSGKTVEIGNTDAEGRLILADAITYAQNKGAKVILDLATLTGAQMVALGPIAALYANTTAYELGLVKHLENAAKSTGEHVHAMPLDHRLKQMLKSKGGADICNFTGVPYAGAGTAALFLEEFVNPGVAYVHLDISGPAFSWFSLGLHHQQDDMGTGFGVALMLEFLDNLMA